MHSADAAQNMIPQMYQLTYEPRSCHSDQPLAFAVCAPLLTEKVQKISRVVQPQNPLGTQGQALHS